MSNQPKKPQDQREMMRWCVLATFITILLTIATTGVFQTFRTDNPAFLGLCTPLLLVMGRAILLYLFPNQKG